MNEKTFIGGSIGTAISGSAIAMSTSELSQWLSIGCTILGLFITIVTAIIIPLVQKKGISADDLKALQDKIDETKHDLEGKE